MTEPVLQKELNDVDSAIKELLNTKPTLQRDPNRKTSINKTIKERLRKRKKKGEKEEEDNNNEEEEKELEKNNEENKIIENAIEENKDLL